MIDRLFHKKKKKQNPAYRPAFLNYIEEYMFKKVIIVFLVSWVMMSRAQCPQVYDYLGNLSNKPYWISCTGTNYLLNFKSATGWSAFTINWGDGSPLYNSANYVANSIITHNYAATVDTFVLTLSIPAQSCTLTGVVVMEQAVIGGVQIPIGGVTQACIPANLQFINSSTNVSKTTKFTWNFGDGTPAVFYPYTNAAQTVSHLYVSGSVNCQTMVTLQAQNYCSFGTPSTASINPIQLFEKDQVTITPSALIKCLPDNSFTFTNNSNRNCVAQGNIFPRKEYWNFGNNWGLGHDSVFSWKPWPPASPHTIAYSAPGTYTVMLRDSNLCGVSQQQISVILMNAPVASVTAASPTVCQHSSITFSNNSTSGFFYQWNFGTGGGFVPGSLGMQSYTYNTPGTYTVKVLVFFPGGGACTDTAQTVVNVLAAPSTNFTYAPVYGCTGINNAIFTDLTPGASAWNWNFGNGNTSTLSAPPPQSYTSTGIYTISLTAGGANLCAGTATAAITVYTPPTSIFTPTSACLNSTVSFTDQSVAAITNTIITWKWNFGDGSPVSSLQHPAHTYTAAGTYSVKLVVNSAFCKDSVISNFVVYPSPQFSIAMNPSSGCGPLTVNFPAVIGAVNSSWNFGDGGNSSLASPVHTFTNTSLSNVSYTVTFVAKDSNGCYDTAYAFPFIHAKPVAGFANAPLSGCAPLSVNFINISSLNVFNNWDFGDGNTANGTNASHTFSSSSVNTNTNYQVKLVVTSVNGCKDSISKSITVWPHPKSGFSVDTPACSSKWLTFTNNSAGANTYNWNFGNGNTSTLVSPAQQYSNTTSANLQYVVQLVATNTLNCSDTLKVSVAVHPKRSTSIIANPDSGCASLSVAFPPIAGIIHYSWNFGDGNSSSAVNPSHVFTNTTSAGINYSVQLIATDAYTCTDTTGKIIKVFSKPTALFEVSPLTVSVPGQVINCTNQSIGNANNYWLFGDGSTSTEVNPLYEYSAEGEYQITLIITDEKGCIDTFSLSEKIVVLEESSIQVPNAFTPNTSAPSGGEYHPNDLSNDIFHPVVKGVDKDRYEFAVYSRWGELLFVTKETTIGWDGYYKGKLCTQDVYVWKIKAITLEGKIINKSGDVTLIKK